MSQKELRRVTVISSCLKGDLAHASPSRLPQRMRESILQLARSRYAGFNDHHLCEKLAEADENFWMKTGYRVPDTPRGTTTPDEMKAGTVKTIPTGKMPVRSFLISPDGATKIPEEMTITLRGIAFGGYGRIVRVEISTNEKTWHEARLGEDHGPYSFRTWEFTWTPPHAGRHSILVRTTDEKGNVQPDEGVWNPGGYLWNKIEREEFIVGTAT